MAWGTRELFRVPLGKALGAAAAGIDVGRLPGATVQSASELRGPAVRDAVRAEHE